MIEIHDVQVLMTYTIDSDRDIYWNFLGVRMDEESYNYLYRQGDKVVLMHPKTLDQIEIEDHLFIGGKKVIAFLSGT
jgi:hypothetical protein